MVAKLPRYEPGVATVASSRMSVSERRHIMWIEIEKNHLAIRVSPVLCVIDIQSGIPFLFPKPSDQNSTVERTEKWKLLSRIVWLHNQLQPFFPTWISDWGGWDSLSCVEGIDVVPLHSKLRVNICLLQFASAWEDVQNDSQIGYGNR